MPKFFISLIFLFLIITGVTQSKYTSFQKVKNGYDTTTLPNGLIVMDGNIFDQNSFQYLNENSNYINKYPDRYDYLKGSTELDINYHLSTVVFGDTSSRSYKGYYLDIHPSYLSDSIIPLSYLSKGFITNRDWNKFKKYVRDSMALEILAYEFDTEEYSTPYYIRSAKGIEKADKYDWNLNWKADISYNKSIKNEMYPYLVFMNYPPHERFRQKTELDTRKLRYTYSEIQNKTIQEEGLIDVLTNHEKLDSIRARNNYEEDYYRNYYRDQMTPLFSDSTLWKLQSKNVHHGDIADQLIHYYASDEDYLNAPIQGITSMQVKAYLNWLQKAHQKKLNAKEKWYYVEYCLPTPFELEKSPIDKNELVIPSFDLSPWRITNADYQDFLYYAIDSIALETLTEQIGLARFKIEILDDELQIMDESEWILNWSNRKEIRKNPKYIKILKEYGLTYPDYISETNTTLDIDYRKIDYQYYIYNFETASQLGKFNKKRYYYVDFPGLYYKLETKIFNTKKWEKYKDGKDLILSWITDPHQNADVRSHSDRSAFIEKIEISLYPGMQCCKNKYCKNRYDNRKTNLVDSCCMSCQVYENKRLPEYDFDSEPKKSVTNITYEQAIAYYNWKQQQNGSVIKHKNNVIANYIPSKTEWINIQQEIEQIHPREIFYNTTPVAKYVVRFYPRNSKSTVPALSYK